MAERSAQESATRTLSDRDFAVGAAERYFEDYVAGAVCEYGYAGVTEADELRWPAPARPGDSLGLRNP
jgi:acyl dehydratase